jgi:hypothetical protein
LQPGQSQSLGLDKHRFHGSGGRGDRDECHQAEQSPGGK